MKRNEENRKHGYEAYIPGMFQVIWVIILAIYQNFRHAADNAMYILTLGGNAAGNEDLNRAEGDGDAAENGNESTAGTRTEEETATVDEAEGDEDAAGSENDAEDDEATTGARTEDEAEGDGNATENVDESTAEGDGDAAGSENDAEGDEDASGSEDDAETEDEAKSEENETNGDADLEEIGTTPPRGRLDSTIDFGNTSPNSITNIDGNTLDLSGAIADES